MHNLVNEPADLVADSLRGFAAAHPDLLRVITSPTRVVRSDAPNPERVAVISGGGSGHEPLHAGFVGAGMLAAAVPGPVFTSPTPDAVGAAIRDTAGSAGALLIVKNYTGDVLNFETAAELAELDGITVRSVLVDDDVAVEDSTHTAGRRGVGATLFVEKIVGAAAERGDDLARCEELARRVVAGSRSMGLALTAPTLPHLGEPSFELGADEVELGIGIHGEPGRRRISAASAEELVRELLEPVLAELPNAGGQDVLLLTNSMGATPPLELYSAHGIAERLLAERGIRVGRRLVGSYVTSLDMRGLSFSLLALDAELTELWDAPVHTAALRW